MTANQAAEKVLASLQELCASVRQITTLTDHINQRANEGDAVSPDLLTQIKLTLDGFYTELEQLTGEKSPMELSR